MPARRRNVRTYYPLSVSARPHLRDFRLRVPIHLHGYDRGEDLPAAGKQTGALVRGRRREGGRRAALLDRRAPQAVPLQREHAVRDARDVQVQALQGRAAVHQGEGAAVWRREHVRVFL